MKWAGCLEMTAPTHLFFLFFVSFFNRKGAAHWGDTSISSFYFYIYLFICLFLAVLGLRCCAQAFSSCNEQGLLFVAVRGLLIAVASLVVEHGL